MFDRLDSVMLQGHCEVLPKNPEVERLRLQGLTFNESVTVPKILRIPHGHVAHCC